MPKPIQLAPAAKPASIPSPVKIASFALALLLCIGVLVYGLLPGLLAVCLGYLWAAALAGEGRRKGLRLSPTLAAAVVVLLPLLGLGLLLANAKGMAFGAVGQYQALMHLLAGTVLEIRQKLPADLASHLPAELIAVQVWLADYLKSKAQALTGFGTAGLHGFLLVYVGLVVGALIEGTRVGSTSAPLRFAIRQRAGHFIEAFRQIVIAQFWIAAINTLCTALFLLVALPLFGVNMPYVSALIALTFFAGLIPIVGNLVCNSVLALAGVSISPAVGLTCLLFLIAIHKTEYVINAKILGKQINTAAWELLAVMFIGEAVFGLPGLVAAPLYYAYAKKELQAARLV
ncbi:MAG: permease [Rhodoferax sp.]|uniref:AI-2E family transporter n=1 Tax=Rhodoferax sp. TaxID=50421 RepID=UPI0017D3782C|nr:permease [Rhodoferax sp.]NMM13012.1 permease [Rhodoferax sp.]